eukprot:CAMPEP_0175644024 /NCGR_PEP_ID=MMETSP0097-20121207/6097_1 /TAXON_ID=311494 /ORGANISM="Alexandrium monilatum, Strain CCMP3105" /LENGTH=49 /DNA_ID= /DNA_START= /DNA_END= /DNA_ORIENTATION=
MAPSSNSSPHSSQFTSYGVGSFTKECPRLQRTWEARNASPVQPPPPTAG